MTRSPPRQQIQRAVFARRIRQEIDGDTRQRLDKKLLVEGLRQRGQVALLMRPFRVRYRHQRAQFGSRPGRWWVAPLGRIAREQNIVAGAQAFSRAGDAQQLPAQQVQLRRGAVDQQAQPQPVVQSPGNAVCHSKRPDQPVLLKQRIRKRLSVSFGLLLQVCQLGRVDDKQEWTHAQLIVFTLPGAKIGDIGPVSFSQRQFNFHLHPVPPRNSWIGSLYMKTQRGFVDQAAPYFHKRR